MVQVADLVASLTAVDTGFAASMFLAEERVKGLHGSTDNALGGIAKLGVGLGLLSGAVLVDAIKQASNYDTMLVHIQSNTGMTDAETKAMSQGIQQLAAATGAPLDQLAQGFMHIHNFGFSAAEAMAILKPAMESALSTGDDVGQVASALGVAMHEFHLNASQATVAMNLLHIAAQEGNATLGQFVDGTTQAFNLAGGFGVKIEDVAAALSTLTQSGQTARMASNGLSSVMAGIVKPTQAAQNAILEISKATHVDLTNAFSATGLKSIGLTGILMRVHDALGKLGPQAQDQVKNMMTYADQLEKTHVSNATFDKDMANYAKNTGGATQALLALFPNIRAFREAMLLTGSQFTSWQTHITDMHATIEGQTNPTLKGFSEYLKLPSTMLAIMGENVHILMIALGESLMPAVKQLLGGMIPLVQAFADWAKGHTQIVAGVLGIGVAIGILSGAVLTLQVAAAPLMSMAVPLLAIAAAAGILYEAWTHDFGGIKEKAEDVWNFLQPLFTTMKQEFTDLSNAFSQGGFSAAFARLPSLFVTVRTEVERMLMTLWSNFTKSVSSIDWGGMARNLINGITALGPRILPGLTSLGSTIKTAFQGYEQWVWSWFGPAVARLLTLIETNGPRLFHQYLGYLTWLKNAGAQFAHAAWSWIEQVWPPLSAGLARVTGNLLGALGNATEPLRAKLGRWAVEFGNWLPGAVSSFLMRWPGVLDNFLSHIDQLVYNLLNRIGDALPGIGKALLKWGGAFADWAGPAALALTKAMVKINLAIIVFVTETVGVIALHLLTWAVEFGLWQLKAIPHLLSGFGKLMTALTNWFLTTGGPQVKKAVDDAFSKAGDWLKEAGKHILSGLIDGMKAHIPSLTDFLGGLSNLIPIHKGPPAADLKLLYANGQLIMQGLIDGMTAKHDDLRKTLASTSNLIAGGIHSGYTGTGAIGAGGSLIVVNVAAGAITTSGTAAHSGLSGDRVGRVVADALETLILAQRTTAPRARASLPGATRGA